MKRAMTMLLILLLTLSATALAAPAASGKTGSAASFLLPKNAVEILAPKGEITVEQQAFVKLPLNAGTGYTWKVKVSSTKQLELVDSSFQADSDMPGSGGYAYFLFEPLKTGTAKLTFSLFAPDAKKAEQTVKISVKIAKAVPDVIPLKSKTSLKIGQKAEVSLEGNPTTGYVWSATLSNPDVLAVAYDQFNTPDGANPNTVGASGMHTFQFEGLNKGKCIVTLVYQRPFEDKPVQKKTYMVTVK